MDTVAVQLTPSIQPVQLEHVSASQIDTFRRCKRLWFNQKIRKVKVPGSVAQERGKRIHAKLEQYLKTHQLPSVNDCDYVLIKKASQYLPDHNDTLIEHEFHLPTFEDGPELLGYIDLVDKKSEEIWDHKTTSDFRYNKTPEELRNNLQMLVYAMWALSLGEEQSVKVRHLYLRTRGTSDVVSSASVVMDRAHVVKNWLEIVATTREMVDLATNPPSTYKDVNPPGDFGDSMSPECHKYGGCYFKSECNANLFQIGRPREAPMASDFVAKLAARKAARVNGTAMTQPLQKVEEPLTSAETPCPGCGGKKYVSEGGAASGWLLCKSCGGSGISRLSIVPPDAPSRVDEPKAATPIEVVEEVTAPTKRKRRTKAEMAASGITASVGTPERKEQIEIASTPLAKALSEKVEEKIAARPVPSVKPRIYVDCYPVKRAEGEPEPVALETWLGPIQDLLAEEHKVEDYGFIDRFQAKPILAAAIRRCLGILPPSIFVSSGTRGADTFLEVVTPHASSIFRGTRG